MAVNSEAEIEQLKTYAVELEQRNSLLTQEVARLKAGKFTPAEFQNLCHSQQEGDSTKFKLGCLDYWRSMFGDEGSELSQRLRKLQAKAAQLERAYQDEIGEALVELARLADKAARWDWVERNLKPLDDNSGGMGPNRGLCGWQLNIPNMVGKWSHTDPAVAVQRIIESEKAKDPEAKF